MRPAMANVADFRKQKIVMMIPEGQEIQPGDIVWLDNAPGELTIRMPDGSLSPTSECEAAEAEPEDTGGDDWGALERDLEQIGDLLNNCEKAKTKVSRQQKEER
jgi:hypothetical protein